MEQSLPWIQDGCDPLHAFTRYSRRATVFDMNVRYILKALKGISIHRSTSVIYYGQFLLFLLPNLLETLLAEATVEGVRGLLLGGGVLDLVTCGTCDDASAEGLFIRGLLRVVS